MGKKLINKKNKGEEYQNECAKIKCHLKKINKIK